MASTNIYMPNQGNVYMWQALKLRPAMLDVTLPTRQLMHKHVNLSVSWFEALMLNVRAEHSCTLPNCWRLLRGTSGKGIEMCRTFHVNTAWNTVLGLFPRLAFGYGCHHRRCSFD